jgi:hypothetical protein
VSNPRTTAKSGVDINSSINLAHSFARFGELKSANYAPVTGAIMRAFASW